MHDKLIESITQEIQERHHEIIEDWAKAYLSQLHQEGIDIKPGCYTLFEQEPAMYDGKYCKRYWFEKGVPYYPDGWKKNTDHPPPKDREFLAFFKNNEAEFQMVLEWESQMYGFSGDDRAFIHEEDFTHWMHCPPKPKD